MMDQVRGCAVESDLTSRVGGFMLSSWIGMQIKQNARGAMGGSGQAQNMNNPSGTQGNLGQGFDNNQGNLGQGFDNTGTATRTICLVRLHRADVFCYSVSAR